MLKKKIGMEDGEVRRSNSASTTSLYDGKSKTPKLCTHKLCSLKALLQSSNDSNPNEKKKTKKKSGMNKTTSESGDHHVLPSFASLARLHQKFGTDEQQQQQQQQQQKKKKKKKKKRMGSSSKTGVAEEEEEEEEEAVFTRLYAEFLHQKQRMEEEKRVCLQQFQEKLDKARPTYTKKTKRLMLLRGRAAKRFKNYGELLYHEALYKDAERRRIAEQRHLEEESDELKEITATPEISKYAKQLKRPDKFWERLSTDNSKRHLRELQHESLELKLMECTFTPRINKKGLGQQETGTANRFDQLFWDAENRRHRQAEYMQWHPEGVTFRPVINPQCCQRNIYGQDLSHNNNVFSRLLQYAAKLSEKKQKWQKNETKPVDPTTGQELFHPQTGRKPYGERKTEAMPIGDFLYQLKFSLDRKRQTLMERDIQKAKELANCQYINPNSSKLLESRRVRRIKQIFDLLDTHQDGFIDLTEVDMTNLESEVVEDLNEVRRIHSPFERHLSLDEFTKLMMSVPKKKWEHLLLNPSKKRAKEENPKPYKFKVNRHSCQLASGLRNPGNSRNWYKLVMSERERRQARIEALRKEKENEELAECTFKPSLHKKDCKGSASFIHGYPISTCTSPRSTAAEKEQQEIHGFFFQEVDMDSSVNSESTEGPLHSSSSSPRSLLQKLKRMISI